ncbi:MAG: acyl-CoA synthetase [Clostridia bacterium BRH_c25]|nr:MAG: acyl-CoA synthetase [Clostridia bacterium BRH_c25]
MNRLVDLAKVLRSKNSGPFEITLDILFDNPASYRRVTESGIINMQKICQLYHLEPKDICNIVFFEKGLGIKITYNRPVSSGTSGDRDVYGAQQHAPLMDILIP